MYAPYSSFSPTRLLQLQDQLTKYRKLLPFSILLIVVLGFAFVGYHIYLSMQKISAAASDKMQKKERCVHERWHEGGSKGTEDGELRRYNAGILG